MRRPVASTRRSAAWRSKGFELGKDLLKRIESGRGRGEEKQRGLHPLDSGAHGRALMAAQIVHNDDIPGRQSR